MEIKRYLPNTIFYRIQNGEDTQTVAKKFNVSVHNIKTFDQTVEEGDFVKVENAFENIYIVKPLDTSKQIADIHNLTEEQIINNNNLKSKVLFIGQRLKL